jgi:DNA gyrase subunit A
VVSENGYGKRSKIDDYRVTNRGGKGVKTINVTDKTGELIAMKSVSDENDLMIITHNGITIRLAVSSISVLGRATQGVRVINLKGDDRIASVARVSVVEDPESEELEDAQVVEDGAEIQNTDNDTGAESSENEENNLEQE